MKCERVFGSPEKEEMFWVVPQLLASQAGLFICKKGVFVRIELFTPTCLKTPFILG